MKVLKKVLASLSFRRSNPGGRWLKGKVEYIEQEGRNKYGAPQIFGSETGEWNQPLLLPVSLLAKVKGNAGEHTFERDTSMGFLKPFMQENNHLPVDYEGRQEIPYIRVAYDGEPWVTEGNHRIKVAKLLGWKYLPVYVIYFTGGEDTATDFAPDKLESYHHKALSEGYSNGEDFRANPKETASFDVTASLQLYFDNPGGYWLKENLDYAKKQGTDGYGAPKRFGEITAYFNQHVLLPVSVISKLRGLRGEQNFTREDSYSWLRNEMGLNNRLPLSKVDQKKQHDPFIQIDWMGEPWVNEGNHRIKVAKDLGWKYLPCQVQFYLGAEDIKDGLLSPDKIKRYHAKALSEGYSVDNFVGDPKKLQHAGIKVLKAKKETSNVKVMVTKKVTAGYGPSDSVANNFENAVEEILSKKHDFELYTDYDDDKGVLNFDFEIEGNIRDEFEAAAKEAAKKTAGIATVEFDYSAKQKGHFIVDVILVADAD